MTRTHLSKDSEIIIQRRDQPEKADAKPCGFWYSVDGDWERWCREEQAAWIQGCKAHEVTLGDERIMEIRTAFDLDLFHEKYHSEVDSPWGPYIDWWRVAEDFDGIEIAPYQWSRGLNGVVSRWYYGWDCASGCVWRPKGIRVRLAAQRPPPAAKGRRGK